MKLKVCLFTLMLFQSLTSFAQYDHLFEFVYPIEQKLQSIQPMNLSSFTPKQLSEAFSRGGVVLSHEGALKMKQGLTRLEAYISYTGPTKTVAEVQSFFATGGFPISLKEAKAIHSHLNGGPKIGGNAHVFFMTLISAKTKAIFEELIEQAYRPAKPNSPVKQSITRLVDRAFTLQTIMLPKTSGVGDWFANAYTAIGARYTSFDDEENNGSGKEEIYSLTLGGDIGADTSLSMSLSQQRSHRGGSDSLTYKSFGGDLMLHHKFNEHFGAGIYGFYQDTDIEDYESHAYGYGSGLLLSSFYDFGLVDVTMINTFNKVWYKYGHDQLYVGSININRDWNDSFSTAFIASYTDSLKHDQAGDNSYWTVGGEVYWTLNENATFIFGYDRTVALTDYKSHSFSLNFIWSF